MSDRDRATGWLATRPANYATHLLYAVLLAGGGVALAIVGRGSTGGDLHTAGGLAGCALCWLAAYALVRRVHPPRLRGVELRLSPEQVAPGAELAVRVEPTRAGVRPLQVGLVCTSIGEHRWVNARGNPQTSERRTLLHESWQDVDGDAVRSLRFEVPAHASPSERTSRSRLFWTVVARRRGRLRFDRQLARTVVVSRSAPSATGAEPPR